MSADLAVKLTTLVVCNCDSILRRVLKVGREVEVRPGIVSKDSEGKLLCKPVFSKIGSLLVGQNDLQDAAPGGLTGLGTNVHPTLCQADTIVGQVLGAAGALAEIFTELDAPISCLAGLGVH